MSLPTDFGTGTVTGHWVTSRGLNGRGQVVFTPRANFSDFAGPNPTTEVTLCVVCQNLPAPTSRSPIGPNRGT